MSQIVKCDICGGVYNASHLNSHKRLSHGKREVLLKTAPPSLEVILSWYAQLPEENKRQVRARLATVDQTSS